MKVGQLRYESTEKVPLSLPTPGYNSHFPGKAFMSLPPPARCALVLLLLSLLCLAQSKPAAKNPAPAKPVPPKPKLTPEQQHGLRLLKASEAEAAGLQPEMRAFALWQVSRGYSKILPGKSKSMLLEAFKVTESVDDNPPEGCEWEVCKMKWYLQNHLLEELLKQDEVTGHYDDVEQMLSHLDPKEKEFTTARLVMEYAEKDQFGKARSLLDRLGDEADYPYWAAEELMVHDPHAEDRLALFDQAVSHFRQEHDAPLQGSDLATMVMRFSRDLPAGTVLDAIDQILARAKDQDEDDKTRAGVNAGGGSVYFDSRYQLRLFQLLPVLEDLDKAKAESLLRDNAEVSHALDKFPRGPQSMDPRSYGDTPLPKGEYSTADVDVVQSKDPAGAATEQAQDQEMARIEAQLEKVLREAEKDPAQAYQDAQELPLDNPFGGASFPPRGDAMQFVARDGIKKDPEIAKKAMNDLRKMSTDWDIAVQARMLTTVPNFYIEVGDMEEARSSIKDLMRLADKLYARDVDSSDPNLLFKGVWPSTALWRRCVQLAAKISPEFAEEIVAQVPDAEIQTFERVNYGATLAGAEPFHASMIEWHKGGRHAGVMF